MDQAKVIEMLNQTILTEYLQKLLSVKLARKTVYPILPITAAPNLSEPRTFLMIEDLLSFIAPKRTDLN